MKKPFIGFKPVYISTLHRSNSGAVQAKWDGKPARPPKKGELYLSGAIVSAYRALQDLDTAYFIAEEIKP